MPTPIFTHPDCIQHDPGPDHPETPQRLRAVVERVSGDPRFSLIEATPATIDQLLAVHPEGYLLQLNGSARTVVGHCSSTP